MAAPVQATTAPAMIIAAAVVWIVACVAAGFVAIATKRSLQEFPGGLDVARDGIVKPVVLARDGTRLSVSLQNAWNTTDIVPLQDMPEFLKRAFVLSEDQHFYEHRGVDWSARVAASWQNLIHGEAVRGASTITEQVVRMLHPRRRTLWSRWLEGFEARRLESRFSKNEILAFYLNQVPYTDRRRGILQAARYYYDRDLGTLSKAEALSLVVLVRSPQGMDLRRNPKRAVQAINRLADRLLVTGDLLMADRERIRNMSLQLTGPHSPLDASHFVRRVLQQSAENGAAMPARLQTSLDAYLQSQMQEVLDTALTSLAKRKVRDGGMLVIDHQRNEILAWVVGRARSAKDPADGERVLGYDTVLMPRQPGSTMKPLLYAMALERGWTAATLIDDSEFSESIGAGLHTFHNYSRVHYGPIRLREALGNSLNVPAVKTLKVVGTEPFLDRLHQLGIVSLRQHPDFYGDGLALGNGEVSLYEMAQAYTTLARRGRFRPLVATMGDMPAAADVQVYSPEVASLIGNIMADPDARRLEFGPGLQFPVETAVKTGTSNDYRDAWAIGFDYAHTVAVWMGNLDGSAMNGVTGSVGPALVLRSAFALLNRGQDTRGLWMSPRLVPLTICRKSGLPADRRCESMTEWFVPNTAPAAAVHATQAASEHSTTSGPGTAASASARTHPTRAATEYRIVEPTPGLQLARDPRIPDELEAFTMSVAPVPDLREVEWHIDGVPVSRTHSGTLTWHLLPGPHEVFAQIRVGDSDEMHTTEPVRFYVR
jgi:penicillin-binding protein 1C